MANGSIDDHSSTFSKESSSSLSLSSSSSNNLSSNDESNLSSSSSKDLSSDDKCNQDEKSDDNASSEVWATNNVDGLCRVKVLQLETGCPIKDYFKLWYQKLKFE